MRTFLILLLATACCFAIEYHVEYVNETDLLVVFLGVFILATLWAMKLDWKEEDEPWHILFEPIIGGE